MGAHGVVNVTGQALLELESGELLQVYYALVTRAERSQGMLRDLSIGGHALSRLATRESLAETERTLVKVRQAAATLGMELGG